MSGRTAHSKAAAGAAANRSGGPFHAARLVRQCALLCALLATLSQPVLAADGPSADTPATAAAHAAAAPALMFVAFGAATLPFDASGAATLPFDAPGAAALPFDASGAAALPSGASGAAALPSGASGAAALPFDAAGAAAIVISLASVHTYDAQSLALADSDVTVRAPARPAWSAAADASNARPKRGWKSARLVEIPRDNVGSQQQYTRPRYALGFQSPGLKHALANVGLDVHSCMAPIVRMRTKMRNGGDVSGTFWLYARCSFR